MFRRLLATIVGTVAVLGCLVPSAAAAPGEPTDPNAPTDTTPVDDAGGATGAVQSWTLTPGGGPDGGDAGSRPNLTYQVAPGTAIQDSVIVYNFGNVTTTFDIYATDALNNDDGEFDLLSRDEVPVDVGSWVSLGATSVTLEPMKQATIPITITVPLDATAGDHIGGIVAAVTTASTTQSETGNEQIINVERRTGTRVYLQVNGALNAKFAVADADITASYDYAVNSFSGAADVSFRVENRGNVRLGGVPTLKVSGPFGLGGTTVTLPEITPLLPGQDVTITTRVEGVPALFFMKAEVSIEPKTFSSVGETPAARGVASFLAVPVTVLLLLLLAFVATMLVRAVRRHSRLDDQPSDTGVPQPPVDRANQPQLQ
jgi:hypothetical protein